MLGVDGSNGQAEPDTATADNRPAKRAKTSGTAARHSKQAKSGTTGGQRKPAQSEPPEPELQQPAPQFADARASGPHEPLVFESPATDGEPCHLQ